MKTVHGHTVCANKEVLYRHIGNKDKKSIFIVSKDITTNGKKAKLKKISSEFKDLLKRKHMVLYLRKKKVLYNL